MSDQKKDQNGEILRDISEIHEDQPGDLAKTVADKPAQPVDEAQATPR